MTHHVIYPQLGCHSAEVFNAGWDDDPDWKAVCDCGWEVWNCSTQELAEACHNGEGYALCTRCKGAQPQRLTPEILKRSLGDD